MTPCVVFVVDDSIVVADSISRILRVAGCQVTTFYDGAEVIAHTPELPPDVVVTDFMMPKVNGLVLTAWIEEHYPQCRIVMISGHAALLADMDRGKHFTVLSKPVNPQKLVDTVRPAGN